MFYIRWLLRPVRIYGNENKDDDDDDDDFLDSRLTDGDKVVSPLPPRKIPGTHFC
jgi:hypothetical protein